MPLEVKAMVPAPAAARESDSPLKIQARARSFPMRPPPPPPATDSDATVARPSAKPTQFTLELECIHQDPPELRQPTSPTSSTTVSSPSAPPATSSVSLDPIREMPVPDPESPAYMALAIANDAKKAEPPSLLDKRMRIGKAKIGRTKYKADRSFKKPAGNEIHDQHEQYALTYGMMCGILNSAGLQNPFKQRLTMDDFMHVEKRSFPASAKLQHAFKFKDYSPDIFRQIRRRFSLDSADYLVTLCGDFNYIEFLSNSKSGQFFFYSHDGRFMIKTQTKDESKFLRRILPHYYKFVMENPNTLITRFYGMHRVKMHHLRRKMHFVIMASVFDTPLEVHGRFDLKGSKVGRRAAPKERSANGVLKDMDLLDSGFRLQMGAERRAMLLVQIRKDVEFLKRMKIMDYSMLIGVHDAHQAIQTTIFQNLNAAADSSTAKSVPNSPNKTALPDVGSSPIPVRVLRSVSDPSAPAGAGAAGYHVSEATATGVGGTPSANDFEPSDLEDSDSEYESNSSDGGGDNYDDASFAVDGSLAGLAISPRILDVAAFPAHSESLFCRDEGGIYGRDRFGRKNGFVYFLGVIDILQQYNTRKIAETFFKGIRHNRKQISSVNPTFYGDRFIEFMEKHVVQDDTLGALAPLEASARARGRHHQPHPQQPQPQSPPENQQQVAHQV